LANKYFFSSLYDSREVIAELSEKLRSTLDASRIYDYISETLEHAFHSKAVGILIFNEKKKEYQVRHNHGFELNGQKGFIGEKKLYQLFIGQNKSIVVEEVKRGDVPIGSAGKKTIKLLEDLKVEILTPLNIKDRTVGLIALGQKESNDMYNDEDLQVLEVVGAQAAIAIENAILYEDQKRFNIKLEKEVEKATHDLKKANEQLIKLDQAKSDFISIASHQLRTPLTVVKGYISMILERNFGDITPKLEDPLDKIYESNDRLIKLVENLLNISRIESGRLQFEAKKMHLEDLATSVVDELSSYAAKKKIKLTLKKPKKALPEVKIDEEKIRQVVMNLIDNAIKYTKQGSVTVEVSKREDNIRFCVIDSGMGIDPKDQVNLFKKFHRGEGTVLVHTEGTGLGLYVARNMLDMHKGKIWAESKGVGKGSKFCFEIPIA
jgi:signal transduction histidine kinase